MLNWIKHWFTKGAGQIEKTALHWIYVALHGIGGVIHTVFGDVNGAWLVLHRAMWSVMDAIRNAGDLAYHGLWWVIRKGLPDAIAWAARELDKVWHWFTVITRRIEHDILNALHLAEHYADSVWTWAWVHIVRPIKNDILSAWKWIHTRGELAWYYVTHPDRLADLIVPVLAGAIARASKPVLTRTGIILTHLVLSNLVRFTHIIEDIITAVL